MAAGRHALAFFLAAGVGAHALDELRGHPLSTGIPARVLTVAATTSIAAAMALGLVDGGRKLLGFVAPGAVLVVGYNLEPVGGWVHNDIGFAVAWGAFPVVVGPYAQHWSISPAVVVGAAAAFFLSLGQRALSTPARDLRRRAAAVSAHVTFADGRSLDLGRAARARAARADVRGGRHRLGSAARPLRPLGVSRLIGRVPRHRVVPRLAIRALAPPSAPPHAAVDAG